ncbi:MAG: DNA recombination protein RmuC [Candidatus Omnitrophica bacterium]|nr:DNA recombination protein RmuC [Candidatus Omnitrophota bacterium]
MTWILAGLLIVFCVIMLGIVLKISSQVNERLNSMTQSIQESNKILGQNLGSATNMFGGVHEKLGKLEETNRQIYEKAKDISSLQELLRAPKFRGQMGETFLENLLSQVLPKDHYLIQYKFKTGDTVDAAIKLGERIVPIDAKFSLENFRKSLETEDEQLKAMHHKKFIQDIKLRTEEIASKYILPQENTFDFAFMYIPAENVYYEVTVKEDMLNYFISKKVIPVSPNTFYAYLQVICLGLKGLKIEENAKVILKNLSGLSNEVSKFKEDFDVLGGHISKASEKYSESQNKLAKFLDILVNIDSAHKTK